MKFSRSSFILATLASSSSFKALAAPTDSRDQRSVARDDLTTTLGSLPIPSLPGAPTSSDGHSSDSKHHARQVPNVAGTLGSIFPGAGSSSTPATAPPSKSDDPSGTPGDGSSSSQPAARSLESRDIGDLVNTVMGILATLLGKAPTAAQVAQAKSILAAVPSGNVPGSHAAFAIGQQNDVAPSDNSTAPAGNSTSVATPAPGNDTDLQAADILALAAMAAAMPPGTPVPVPGVPVSIPGVPVPIPGVPVPIPGVPVPLPALPVPLPGLPVPLPGLPVPLPGLPVPLPPLPVPLPPLPVVSPSPPSGPPTPPSPPAGAPTPPSPPAGPAPPSPPAGAAPSS
ncbi:hypothetical protein EUX98_g7939 [Antrodiella citrinella]|uniref:Uncharacterized protein n=1 Tax=Antrodiella citrinella TaxID=2447956 RepID=A0A4S4MCS7_9APHY|nr:hypothetical protein EUX98_g7939 [Antrodiella citrinella]